MRSVVDKSNLGVFLVSFQPCHSEEPWSSTRVTTDQPVLQWLLGDAVNPQRIPQVLPAAMCADISSELLPGGLGALGVSPWQCSAPCCSHSIVHLLREGVGSKDVHRHRGRTAVRIASDPHGGCCRCCGTCRHSSMHVFPSCISQLYAVLQVSW